VQLRFDGVILPGYGWVFPLSKTSANVGAGFFARGRDKARMPSSPQAAFEQFTSIPALQNLIGSAAQTSPVKSYPLRVDFTTAPTFGKRILLVGEAAGLVNPVSGDGIDYALESGIMAGEHLGKMLDTGDFSEARHQEYDALLREKYQDLFIFCERIRDLCLKRPYLNTLMRVATYREDLAMALIQAVLGAKPISRDLSARRIVRSVLGV
jgi:flavin-dependent dehydrogenase